MNLYEAFRALDALNEDTFSFSDDGINKLSEFEHNDDLEDDIKVIDTDAETEDDLQDSYVGKVILDCSVCHSKLYKDKEEVELNDEGTMANVGEECPYCYTSDGFKVIGEVSEFNNSDEDESDESAEDDVDEGLIDANVTANVTANGNNVPVLNTSLGKGGIKESANRKGIKIISENSRIQEAYEDTDGIMGEKGAKYTEDQLRTYFDSEKDNDPVLKSYKGNADKWMQDTLKGMKKVNESTLLERSKADFNNMKSEFESQVEMITKNKSLDDVANELVGLLRDSINEYRFFETKQANHQTDKSSMFKMFSEKADGILAIYTNLLKLLKKPTNFVAPGSLISNAMSKILGSYTSDSKSYGRVENYSNMLNDISNIEADKKVKIDALKNFYKVLMYYVNDDLQSLKSAPKETLFKESMSRKIKESVNNVNVETDDSVVNVSTDDNGKVTVTTEPNSASGDGEEVLSPISDETEDTIMNNNADDLDIDSEATDVAAEDEEAPAEGEEESVDADVEEFDEESFDELGESYLRNIYENVNGYKTTKVSSKGNRLFIEGNIKFNSGKVGKTSFIFEAKDITKSGTARFIGENKNITRGSKSFTIKGKLNEGKFISESLNYNYRAKDDSGKSTRVYGTVKVGKRG